MMDSESSYSALTPQEHQVLHLLARGANSPTIAAELGLSTRTVATEIQSLVQKLDVHTRLEAVVRYFQSDEDAGLREELWQLSPSSRDVLVRWLLAEEGDREGIASQALKRRENRVQPEIADEQRRENREALAEHIATLTTHPGQRQRFLRLLRDIDPESGK